MTKYLWVESVAERWGVSKSWVYRLCKEGRVSGAFFSEGRWSIPENAEKPIDYRIHKRYIKAVAGSKRHELPAILPMKLTGESDRIPDEIDKVIGECADYVLDLIDVHPCSGKLFFCALSYEHIKAFVVCENYAQYCYFSSLKNSPDELYSYYSMICFEYSMLTPDRRKEYFDEKKCIYNSRKSDSLPENAALLLFLAGALGQRALDIDAESGEVRSAYKKREAYSFAQKEELLSLSRLLLRAEIYRDMDEACEKMNFSEYSALHLSEAQQADAHFDDIAKKVERLIII